MKFVQRVLNLGVTDEDGDMFPTDAEISFYNPLPVIDPVDLTVHGTATLERKEDHILAEIEVFDETAIGKLINNIREKKIPIKVFPAINGMVYNRDDRDDHLIKKCAISSIELCFRGNSDPTIPPLNFEDSEGFSVDVIDGKI